MEEPKKPGRDWRWYAAAVRWGMGLGTVLGVGIAAFAFQVGSGSGNQYAYVSKAVMYAGVSILLEHPLVFTVLNLAVGLLLFLFVIPDVKAAPKLRQVLCQLALSLNRSAGHMEALLAWTALSLVHLDQVWQQAMAVTAFFTLGPVAIDSIRARALRGRQGAWPLGVLHGITLLGAVLFVVASDPSQASRASVLFLPLLAGMLPRMIWYGMRSKAPERRSRAGSAWAERVERGLLVGALAAAVLLPLSGFGAADSAFAKDQENRTADWSRCDPVESPAQLSLFLVSDNQYHALDGQRSGFHLPAVDAVVPVSVRPVQLDLLSEITLLHFAEIYRSLHAQRPEMKWAHLGDVADLGCKSELERFGGAINAFGREQLASLAIGNHDLTFVGNVDWHPEWTSACPGGRADAAFTREWYARHLVDGGRSLGRERAFLASVVKLGEVGGRPVVGAFLDTNEWPYDALGVAGAQGGISRTQREWVETELKKHGEARVILFGHHPTAALTRSSLQQLDLLAKSLGDRLWAVVSAHTHLAGIREAKLTGRRIPEWILGSTTDAPQEAAVLEGGLSDGAPFLRLRTIPAVARDGMTCPGGDQGIPEARCRELLGALSNRPNCRGVFGRWQVRYPKETLVELLGPQATVPQTPEAVKRQQERRAYELLECIDPAKGAWPDPFLGNDIYSRLAEASGELRARLVCLSWAASILQSHKSERWGLAQALEFSLEKSATFGAFDVQEPRPQPAPSAPMVGASPEAL
ncbi:MAG: hypothetical protein M3Y59_07475 [Myxococcota bacterium]|nr:hypothetical protein [Myxococcota bacterium]